MGRKEENLLGFLLAGVGLLLIWVAFSNSLQNKVPFDIVTSWPAIAAGIVLLCLGYIITKK